LGELGTAFTGLREAIDGRAYIERYVQTLTHEMKSPLSAIRGAAELLNEDLPAAERERFLRNIQAETGRLQSLVDMLLQLAALECRANDVEPVDVHPAGLIQDVLDSLRPLLVARHLDVSISCEPQVILHGELFLLRQALSNLVQNAIDFSPVSGRIEIQLSSDHGFTELRVLDRGAGIPDFARGRIFERFYSLPRPDSGRKGSGLGLNLVREVALVHGGTVLLTDRNGGGTVATLRLPVADVVPTSDSPS
jgi:two-component system sensor histidine kinase CreC